MYFAERWSGHPGRARIYLKRNQSENNHKIPYGLADFQKIREENWFYVDRTDCISLIEPTGDQILFLRPRRFGKSLWLSVLENYYDSRQGEPVRGPFRGFENRTEQGNRIKVFLARHLQITKGFLAADKVYLYLNCGTLTIDKQETKSKLTPRLLKVGSISDIIHVFVN